MNLLKQSVLGYQLKPKYLAIVGSHPYIPSDYLFDLFHSDFQYTQFDTDQYPDVLFGRLVTIDLQDIFTQLNNIFYYDITAKNVKYKADIHFCNSGLTSSGSTFDCFSTSEKQICSLAGYLQSKGFNVHTYEDSGMNQTSFINSLSNSGVIFKENHGNQWGTSLSDSFFTASNIPLMNPTTYLTGSCLTADYPAVLPREDSYILSYFRNNGIGYLGAMSPGQSLINKIGFISKGEKQSNIAYNGIEGVGDGVTYFGDPAFNPHYIPDNESKINYTFSKISANSYQLDVEIPASETIFYCNAGLFPKRFDYYASRLNGDYVYGVQVKRFEIDNSQNKIISANLTRYEFDSQQNPVQAECTGPASKQEQQSYFCTTFQPNRNDLFITIKGTGSQVEIFSCDIDKDIFNNKTYVLCHLSTPYAPLDAEKINIAKLKEYNIDIRTSS